MSMYSYQESKKAAVMFDFDTLIMAAIRHADTYNSDKLKEAFPLLYWELVKRYNAPGGFLNQNGGKLEGE